MPIIQGGMGVGISMGGLAGAVAREGGMGVISTANIGFREADFRTNTTEADKRALRREIMKAREISEGKGMIAVNVMVATSRFADMVRTAAECGIDAVISGAGLPLELPGLVAEGGHLIAPIVSSGKAARLICRYWNENHDRRPDFIVIEGARAGGHLGFAREELLENRADTLENILKDVMEAAPGIPLFVAGGVFTKEEIEAFIDSGAAGVQMATRFIATAECDASQGFKDVIIGAGEEDVVIIQSPVGMPGRGIRTPLLERTAAGVKTGASHCISCLKSCKRDNAPYCIGDALIAAFSGDLENGLFFCGGRVGEVREMTTVRKLMTELAPERII